MTIIIFPFVKTFICYCNTSTREIYRNVPAEILIKNAITKSPLPIRKLPVSKPKMLTNPWMKIMIVVVLRLNPYFL